MGLNIMIAGAAGYIGGSLLADLVANPSPLLKPSNIIAVVRTEEQARRLSKLGVHVIEVDLGDEAAVTETILRHEIDVVVNAASSFDPAVAVGLMRALGQRRTSNRKETYFIHSSVIAIFSPEAGWPFAGEVNDAGNIFEQEKKLGCSHAVHDNNILVVEEARKYGVTAFNIMVPIVYGRGSGEGRKLSAFIPAVIRSGITHKVLYKFDKDGNPPATHISDLTTLYTLLLQNIMQGKIIPSGERGYYLAVAHYIPTWETMQRIAESLSRRGLVAEPETKVWPSDEMAAESLKYPLPFVRTMGGTYSGEFTPTNAHGLGWQPKWDKDRFLQSIDDEVEAVQEVGTVEDSIFYALLIPPKK